MHPKVALTGLSLYSLWLATSPFASAQLRSFGEAEGYGAVTTGARASAAPTIYHVTNLNDSGAGSFRDAVSASNRIVVFDVGGVVNFSSAVLIHSNTTIAGQTAPGGGIYFTGAEISGSSQSNIIMRHLRVSPGDASSSSDDALALYNSQNIMVDHCSFNFAKYDNIDAVTDNGASPQVTIQNCIIADPIGQQFGAHLEAIYGNFTLTKNLWVNSHNRNPLAKINEQFINNVNYNYEAAYTTHTSTPFKHDLVNNMFIYGPATGGNTYYQLSSGDTFYAVGNTVDTNKNGVLETGSILNPTTGTIVSSPNFVSTPTLPTLSVADTYNFVVAHAGASITRNELDNLIVSQVQTLGAGTAGKTAGTSGPTGGLYGSAASTGLSNGGLGTVASGSRPAGFDSDNDGIPNTWETAHGLNPNLASDALLRDPLGYFMIEKYINELGAVNDSRNTTTSGNWATAANWTGSVAPSPLDYVSIQGNGTSNSAVTVSSGTASAMTLALGGSGPAAGETLTVSGGKLDVYDTITVGDQNNATLTINGGLVEAYNVILGNTVYAPGATNYTGSVTLSSGTLALSQLVLGAGTPGNWNAGGSLTFTGGTLKAIGTLNVNVPIAVSASGGTVDTAGYNGTISGVISGSAGITKKGTGTLTLSGTNTNTGVTTVKAGSLAFAAFTNGGVAGNLGAASNAAANLVLDGGTLRYVGTTATTTDRLFTITAAGGTLDAGSTGQWRFLSTGAAVSSGTGNRTLTLTGSTTLSDLYPSLADPSSGKLYLVMNGTGRWILNNPATPRSYSGDTIINSGTLMQNSANQLPYGTGKGNLIINAGTFELNGNDLAINALTGAGTLNNRGSNSRTVTLGNGDASGTFSGVISDTPLSGAATLGLTKVGLGTQVLTGTNTYDGVTTVTAGILQIGNGGTTGNFGTGAIIDNATLALNRSDALAIGNPISGSGGLSQLSSGTTAFSGAVALAGNSNIASGQLVFSGGVAHSLGRVTGSGTLQVAAGTSLTTDAVVLPALQVNGTHILAANGSGASKLNALTIAGASGNWTGHFEINNNLLVIQTADTTSKAAALSTLLDQIANTSGGATGLTSNSVAGDPGHKALFAIDNALLGNTLFGDQPVDANSILVAATYKGDANLDRKVDVIDLGVLATNYGATTTGGITKGDYNNDGKVDVIDLGILATDYGLGTTGGGFTLQQDLAGFPNLSAPVPEPASLALLSLPLLLLRRRSPGRAR